MSRSYWWVAHSTKTCVYLMVGIAIFLAMHFDVRAQEPYFIDAHSQIDPSVDPETIVASLERGGIRRAILSTIYNVSQEKVLCLALRCPDRVIPAVRTKGYMRNGQH